jgi:gluconate 5-dehydrogenase
MSTDTLTGRTALVTGSTRGLGWVLAQGLARSGAHVICHGRNEDSVRRSVETLRDQGFESTAAVFDVTDELSVRSGIGTLFEKGLAVDVLINNAGVQVRAPLEDFPLKDWERVIGTNLTAPFLVARAVVPRMIEQRRGKIVNICSLQSILGRRTIAPYAASKGGLAMLTRAMCTEWAAHNIQVNGIAPGYFATEMTRALREDEEFNGWLISRTPARRWGDPEELVGAAVLFSGAGSDFINGQILYVDGGISAAI